MTTLNDDRVGRLLDQLHHNADATDRPLFEKMLKQAEAGGMEQAISQMVAASADYRRVASDFSENFLAVSPSYGRFLYALARATRAKRIVEFGTSMGVSTIYLAAALRDNGGGHLIGSELEPAKAARARAHLDAVGLLDLVDVREGDALDTLQDVAGEVDLLLIDGAWPLYLPVLKLVEPHLRTGAIVLAENAFAQDYLDHVRNPAHGYICQTLPIDEGRGNEFAVKVG
jgi:predicted O-methyltransferase YrrM